MKKLTLILLLAVLIMLPFGCGWLERDNINLFTFMANPPQIVSGQNTILTVIVSDPTHKRIDITFNGAGRFPNGVNYTMDPDFPLRSIYYPPRNVTKYNIIDIVYAVIRDANNDEIGRLSAEIVVEPEPED